MPPTRTSLRERWLTPRTVTILVAVAVALPAAYLFHVTSPAEQADFLLLLVLGVGVPTALDGTEPDSLPGVVARTIGACVVVGALFAVVYLGTLSVTGRFQAAVVAFVVSYVGPALAVGYLRRWPA